MHIANTHKRRHVWLVWLSREWISKEENSFDWAAATVVAVPVYVSKPKTGGLIGMLEKV